jgi:Flp pilus assembly protein TadG
MTRRFDRLEDQLRAFARNTRANTAMVFAVSLVPMLLAVGMAYDYARAVDLEARLQSSLDAGALAAAASATLSDTERASLAGFAFDENFMSRATADLKAAPWVKINRDKISMSVKVDYPTTFMRIVGIKTMKLGGSVEVAIPRDKKAEIALVLDYSGSMKEVSGGKVKYVAMREAAIKLVDDLSGKGKSDKVKFGLVPFSHHVYAALPGEYVVGGTPGKTWTGCTQDRKYPYNLSDATPVAGADASKWGQPNAKVHAGSGCDGYLPRKLVVKPIGKDFAGVKAQLEVMQPYAWTHIALGFEFGWHLLSPNAPFAGTAAYDDDETMKVLVLLTDGKQTEPAFGPGSIRNVAQGENNLSAQCVNARAEGVIVVTVAFDLQDDATKNRLRDCASDPDKYFFIAEDDDQLAAAFDQIKAALKTAIYISR